MEEILRNLIKSYSEPKSSQEPKQFKFYSNLSITQPIQKQTQLSKRISDGFEFLSEQSKSPQFAKIGFQSRVISNLNKPNDFVESEDGDVKSYENSDIKFPLEIYTSILALDLLGDEDSEEEDQESHSDRGKNITDSEYEIKQIKTTIIKSLTNFILPECGVTTFNIFKNGTKLNPNPPKTPRSISSASITSATSFSTLSGSDHEEIAISIDIGSESESDQDNFDIDTHELYTFSSSNSNSASSSPSESVPLIPDDCNTTALAIALLLREGILDIKPTASITELLLSNVNPDSTELNLNPGVIRLFLNGSEEIDPIACANVLYLYYLTEMSLNYEENVESTELFLTKTLSLLTHSQDKLPKLLLNHSLDALLYFLSRTMTISQKADRFTQPFITLLERRIGQTNNVLDISMRILAADLLGLLTHEGNWIRRKLEEDFDTLVSLQNKDGSWPADPLFRVKLEGDKEVWFGGKEISTVFACRALEVYSKGVKEDKIIKRGYREYLY